jgi:DNA-directed RNA polymerase subunit alpha
MNAIPLPKSITHAKAGTNHGTFVIEPLYPGYGMTVGNTLRRVLLSSLPGAAITAVKIEGVDHEFSALPYVKEDAVDILLNLKLVRLTCHSDEPVTVTLKANGAKVVTAGDIQPNAQVEVINVDQPILTLTDKAGSVEMELTVQSGRGYIPVENREKEKLPIGTIAIDAIYTPVKNVNFKTEHVRVEQMTNFDKLILDITTDGTMKPEDALAQAAQIMVEHFQFVLNGPAAAEVVEAAPEVVAEAEPVAEAVEDETDEKPKKKAAKKKKADEEPAE